MTEEPKKSRKRRKPNVNPFPVTEEQIARLRPHQFKPGQSGNPKGSTKTNRELQELFRAEAPSAIARIVDIAENGHRDSDRLKANMYIANKFVSDAAQRHEHDVLVTSSGDFLARVAAARAMIARPDVVNVIPANVIEVQPEKNN